MSQERRTGSISPVVFIAASCLGTLVAVLLWAVGASGTAIAVGYFGSPVLLLVYGRVFSRGGPTLGRIFRSVRPAEAASANVIDHPAVAPHRRRFPPASGSGDS